MYTYINIGDRVGWGKMGFNFGELWVLVKFKIGKPNSIQITLVHS